MMRARMHSDALMSAFSQMAKIWEAGTCFWAVAKVSNGVAIAKWALGKLIFRAWYPDGSHQSISLFFRSAHCGETAEVHNGGELAAPRAANVGDSAAKQSISACC